MAVGIHKAGVDPLAGGVDYLLARGGGEVGGEGGDDAVLDGDVALPGLWVNRVENQTVLNEHVRYLLICLFVHIIRQYR